MIKLKITALGRYAFTCDACKTVSGHNFSKKETLRFARRHLRRDLIAIGLIYQMPDGVWAASVCGSISEPFDSRQAAKAWTEDTVDTFLDEMFAEARLAETRPGLVMTQPGP